MGRRIHKRGEVCAFCGAPISDTVFEELEKYFSADEVKEFREQIIRKEDTYTKFNATDHNKFCAKKSGAMKLLNVNSHSIDDLEADLCGKSKQEIAHIFCECFSLNGAIEHFKLHWSEFDTAFLE